MKAGNRLVKGDALLGITYADIQRPLCRTNAATSHPIAPIVERTHRHFKAVAHPAQPIAVRHAYIVEEEFAGITGLEPEFAGHLAAAKAGTFGVNQKSDHALVFGARLRLGKDDRHIGPRAIADPDLLAIEHPFIAFWFGSG